MLKNILFSCEDYLLVSLFTNSIMTEWKAEFLSFLGIGLFCRKILVITINILLGFEFFTYTTFFSYILLYLVFFFSPVIASAAKNNIIHGANCCN